LPFGDGLSCTGSITSPTEHHFTGKERDTESGNDYFEARYYSSNMGRFMSPDWSAQEEPVPYAKLDDPQSLNLYAYLENNPLRTTDPDGHGDQDDYAARIAAQAASENGHDNWDTNKIDVSNGQVFWSGSNKCNEFVSDQVVYAGGPTPVVVGTDKIPTAAQMADPNVKIVGFSEPRPLSEAKPGDIIAQDHGRSADGKREDAHAGIVVAPGKTASSNAKEGGRVKVNDWGFRKPNATPNNGERNGPASPPPVVRHPLPPPPKHKPDGPPRP
jgi:RHS repeat-associated protein